MTKTNMNGASLGEHLSNFKNSIWNSASEEDGRDEWQHPVYNTNSHSYNLGSELIREHSVRNFDGFRRCWVKPALPHHSMPEDGSEGTATQCADELKSLEDFDTLEELWRNFSRHTSMHGVTNIENHERRRFSRVFWLILVMGMSTVLIYTVASLMIEYYQYNTMTRTDVKVHTKTAFPSVTLCNTCPYRRKADTPDAVSRLVSSTTKLARFLPVNFTDPDIIAFLARSMFEVQDEYSFKPEDLFFTATYEGQPLNVSEDFELIETSFGRCFTFNGPQYIARHGSRLVTTDGRNSGLRAYVRLFQDDYFIFEDMTAGIRINNKERSG
ncbi:acid-sensing ion channel 3 [Elysia marginata]|uniref:Acid-sensing ion channel 3 n=1 Tax=Elysia marginata TaxID=1093978 RepID=A0AAV4FN17_9GAST|nr:acid-sensing ion channel 3 [Elysia marginata]